MATNRPGELERFRDLPPKLFSKILRSRADTGVLLSEINTATAKKAERGYLYEECATKISRKEIIDELAIVSKRRGGDVLLNLQPGKFEPSFIVMIGSSVLSDIILRRARIPEMRRGYFYEQLDLVSLRLRPKSYAVNVSHDMGMMANVFFTDDSIEAVPEDFGTDVVPSLFASHEIWKKRRGCMRRDDKYADRQMVEQYNREVAPDLADNVDLAELKRFLTISYINAVEIARDMEQFYKDEIPKSSYMRDKLLRHFNYAREQIMNKVIAMTGTERVGDGHQLVLPVSAFVQATLEEVLIDPLRDEERIARAVDQPQDYHREDGKVISEAVRFAGKAALEPWFKGEVAAKYINNRNRSINLLDATVDYQLHTGGHLVEYVFKADPRPLKDRQYSVSYLYALRKALTTPLEGVFLEGTKKASFGAVMISLYLREAARFPDDLILDCLDADYESITESMAVPWRYEDFLSTPYCRLTGILTDRVRSQSFLWLHIMFPSSSSMLIANLRVVNNHGACLYIGDPDQFFDDIMLTVRQQYAARDVSVTVFYSLVARFSKRENRDRAREVLRDLERADGVNAQDIALREREAVQVARHYPIPTNYPALKKIYLAAAKRGILDEGEAKDLIDELLAASPDKGDPWTLEVIEQVRMRYGLPGEW